MNPEPIAALRGLSATETTLGGSTLGGPTVALQVTDMLRRRRLESVLDRASEAAADVLVVDLAPGEAPPADRRIPVLALSDDPELAADTSLAGVLRRGASARQITAAVAALVEGLHVRGPVDPAETGEASAALPAEPPFTALTPRERGILALVGEGLSNKVIARRLGISAHTVKYHLEAVFAKLAVRSRTQAVAQGLRRGLVVL